MVLVPGFGLPANDPNLSLDTGNGHLVIGSTRSDFNLTGFGRNLTAMEAPALLMSGIGSGDFVVKAKFLDLHVDEASDQIGVFVGTSVDKVLRGGVFEQIPFGGYGTAFNFSQNGTDGAPTNGAVANFQPGQDGVFEIGRIGGAWHFAWQNLSNPVNSGSFTSFSVPGLDLENDLYVGVFNHDARNFTPQNATLDYFEVRTGVDVPEPSSIVVFGVGIVGFLFIARRRLTAQHFLSVALCF
ncbi:MAG: PEP-CTERM sorting domain-containing protein [Planctomycetota bacterium]|mgnify:CR=1 FL=1|nr:MAG: PEP-CTERM sorting domain-containing protein [Planctomycetota bacterium]